MFDLKHLHRLPRTARTSEKISRVAIKLGFLRWRDKPSATALPAVASCSNQSLTDIMLLINSIFYVKANVSVALVSLSWGSFMTFSTSLTFRPYITSSVGPELMSTSHASDIAFVVARFIGGRSHS